MPETSEAIINEKCDNVLSDEVIKPSISPWLSTVVLVKKEGGGIHFRVDYRHKPDYPMPRMEEMFDERDVVVYRTRSIIRILDYFCAPKGPTKNCFLWRVQTISILLSSAQQRYCPQHISVYHELCPVICLHGIPGTSWTQESVCLPCNISSFLDSWLCLRKFDQIGQISASVTVIQVHSFLGCTGFFPKHISNYTWIAAPLTECICKGPGNSKRYICKKHSEDETAFPLCLTKKVWFPQYLRSIYRCINDRIRVCLMQWDDKGLPCTVSCFARKLCNAKQSTSALHNESHISSSWGSYSFWRQIFSHPFGGCYSFSLERILYSTVLQVS